MFVIKVSDFSRGDSWVLNFGKKSPRARAMSLNTVREKHFAKTFQTQEEAASYAARIERAYLMVDGVEFDLDVVAA